MLLAIKGSTFERLPFYHLPSPSTDTATDIVKLIGVCIRYPADINPNSTTWLSPTVLGPVDAHGITSTVLFGGRLTKRTDQAFEADFLVHRDLRKRQFRSGTKLCGSARRPARPELAPCFGPAPKSLFSWLQVSIYLRYLTCDHRRYNPYRYVSMECRAPIIIPSRQMGKHRSYSIPFSTRACVIMSFLSALRA